MQSSSRKLKRQSWLIFALLTMCYGLVSFFRTSTGTLAVDLMREFAVGGGQLAVMSSAYFYPYGFMQIPAGIFSDRWGPRGTIALFLLLGAGGALIFAQAASVTTAVAGRVLIGLGMGMVFVPALRVILSWFPPKHHALGTGLLLSLGSGGMLAATYPLMLLSEMAGWRGAMLAAALVTVLMAVLVWIFVRNKPEDKGLYPPWRNIWHEQDGADRKARPAPPLGRTMRFILRTRTYWCVSIWFFCMYGSFYAISSLWAGPWLIQGYGLSKDEAGGVLFCMALGAIAGPSVVGFLAMWMHVSKAALLAWASGSSMFLGLPFLFAGPVLPHGLLPLWAFLFGALCGGFGGIALTKVQEDFAPDIVGTATGMINIYSYVGTALLQLASGWFMELRAPGAESYTLAQYSAMFPLFFTLFAVALGAALLSLAAPASRRAGGTALTRP